MSNSNKTYQAYVDRYQRNKKKNIYEAYFEKYNQDEIKKQQRVYNRSAKNYDKTYKQYVETLKDYNKDLGEFQSQLKFIEEDRIGPVKSDSLEKMRETEKRLNNLSEKLDNQSRKMRSSLAVIGDNKSRNKVFNELNKRNTSVSNNRSQISENNKNYTDYKNGAELFNTAREQYFLKNSTSNELTKYINDINEGHDQYSDRLIELKNERLDALENRKNSYTAIPLSQSEEEEYNKLISEDWRGKQQDKIRREKRTSQLTELRDTKKVEENLAEISNPFTSLPDFDKISVYVEDKNAKPVKTISNGFYSKEVINTIDNKGDLNVSGVYDFINTNRENYQKYYTQYGDRNDADRELDVTEALMSYKDKLAFMSDDEVKKYNAIYNSGDKAKAKQYIETLMPLLEERLNAAGEGYMADYATKHPIVSNLSSVLVKPVADIAAGVDIIAQKATGQELNTDSIWQQPSKGIEIVRQTTSENIGNGTLSAMYNIGMSILDSAYGLATFGKGTSVAMGIGAGVSTIRDAKERGATDEQALQLGGYAAVFEALFEKFSIDRLLSPKAGAGVKHWIKETLKQMGTEASEETATEIMNMLADDSIMGELSQYNLSVDNYISEYGMSESEAREKAKRDSISRIGEATIGGLISGGVMGGIINAYNSAQYSRTQSYFENRLEEAGESGVSYDKAYKDISDRYGSETISQYDAKKLSEAFTKGRQNYVDNAVEDVFNEPTEQKIIHIGANEDLTAEFEARTGTDLTGTKGAERYSLMMNAINSDQEGRNFTQESFDNLVKEKSTGVQFRDMDKYTPAQRGTIKEFLNSVNNTIKEAAETYRKNKNAPFKRIKISDVTAREANDIKNILGVDVSGYTHNINKSAFEHIEKRHGINGKADSTMADTNDVARIDYVIHNYDTVEILKDDKGNIEYSKGFRNINGQWSPMIIYSKKIDGTMYVVEAATESKSNRLWVVTAYIKRKDGFTQVHHAYKDLPVTSETKVAYHPSSNTNISQNDNSVNSSIRNNTVSNSIQEDIEKYNAVVADSSQYNENRWIADNLNEANQKNKNLKIKSLNKIVQETKDILRIPISTGRIKHHGVLGIFKVKAEAIRTITTNDLPTICHEVGHDLDKRYSLSKIPSIDEAISKMNPGFAQLYEKRELPGEAVAEFTREYLKDKKAAKETYPKFFDEFEKAIAKDSQFKRKLDRLANNINAYMNADLKDRALASNAGVRSRGKHSIQDVGVENWLSNKVDEIIIKYQNSGYAIKKNFSEQTWQIYSNSLGAESIVRSAIDLYLPDRNGDKVYDSLKTILEPIADSEFNEFEIYLKLNHAIEYADHSMRTFADERLQDVETMQKLINELENDHPKFKEVSDRIYEYNRLLVQTWLVDTGMITQETADVLFKKFPKYVPFFRKTDDVEMYVKSRRSIANQKADIGRAKGGGGDTYSPIANIAENAYKFITAAKRNEVMGAIIKEVESKEGMGWLLERVPPKMVPKEVSLQPVLKVLESLENEINIGLIQDTLDDVFGNRLTEFKVSESQGKNFITYHNRGKNTYYEVHDDKLLAALLSMTKRQRSYIAFYKISRIFKTVTTGANLWFSVTNPIRDVDGAWKKSSELNPAEFTSSIAKAMVSVIKKDENYQKFIASGGGFNTAIASPKKIQQLLPQLYESNPNVVRKFIKKRIHPILFIEDITEISEMAPRLAEFNRVIENGGSTIEAIYAADNITTNFKLSGTSNVKAFIPYFNSKVQGLARTYEELRTHPKRYLTKVAISATLMVILQRAFAHLFGSEDEYAKLSGYMKNNYYNFAIGNGKFIRIPKAHEDAYLASLLERAVDQIKGDMEEEDWRYFLEYTWDTFIPSPLPFPEISSDGIDWGKMLKNATNDFIFGGVAQGIANEDYRGSAIVPYYADDIPLGEQYDENTTAIAKIIGQTLNMSPMMIDHLINNYLGFIGTVNKSLGTENKDFTLGMGTKFISDSAYSNDIINRFYDEAKRASVKANSSKATGCDIVLNWEYTRMKQVLSTMNQFAYVENITPDRKREIRMMIRDIVDEFSNSPPTSYATELGDLLDRLDRFNDTDTSSESGKSEQSGISLSAPTLESTLAYGSKSQRLTFEEYVDYVEEYNTELDEAYIEILSNDDYSDDDKISLLDKASSAIKAKLKAKYYRKVRDSKGGK